MYGHLPSITLYLTFIYAEYFCGLLPYIDWTMMLFFKNYVTSMIFSIYFYPIYFCQMFKSLWALPAVRTGLLRRDPSLMPPKLPWNAAWSGNWLSVPKSYSLNLPIPDRSHPFSPHFQSISFLNSSQIHDFSLFPFPLAVRSLDPHLTISYYIQSPVYVLSTPPRWFFKNRNEIHVT